MVLLDEYPPDAVLKRIAMENNLPETCLSCEKTAWQWRLRWFTPDIEMDLCGHATLASAHILLRRQVFPGILLSSNCFRYIESQKRIYHGWSLLYNGPAIKAGRSFKFAGTDI